MNVYHFKKLSPKKKLLHEIFTKKFGNFSLKFDSKAKVIQNKKKIAAYLEISWQNIHMVKQVHGTDIQIITKQKFSYPEQEADGLVTSKPNIFLLIKTADCFPTFIYDKKNKVVALIHVGWRGAIEKIFLNTVLVMVNKFNSQPKDLLVGIGPGIGPCCFKHKTLVQSKLPEWQSYIKELKKGWKSIDIAKFITDQLIKVGVRLKNIENINICTSCDKRFYSHFRSHRTGEEEGRFASVIGIRR